MPSSLAAALAASKANPPSKSPNSSSLAQYQKKHPEHNISKEETHSAKRTPNKNVPKKRYDNSIGNSSKNNNNNKNYYDRVPTKQQSSKSNKSLRKQTGNDQTATAEEIVFICDIPSDSEDEYKEDLDFDTLQISNRQSGGRGKGGRDNRNQQNGRGKNDRNNRGGRLNVNASRRLIGHALGKRIDPRNDDSRNQNNDRTQRNTGAMPTPWSKKAQEMKNEVNINCGNDRQTNSRWDNNPSCNRNNNNNTSKQPSVAPAEPVKLESAKIKGRWADEDSSDDE